MRRCTILIATLVACEHEPTQAPVPPPVPEPAVAIVHADAAPAPAPDCAPRPIAEPTATCEPPPAAVVDRIAAQINAVSRAGAPVRPDTIAFSCPLARGWLATVDLMPRPSFHGGMDDGCPPAAGECGVIATWLVPPTGAPVLQRGMRVLSNLDIDGDGHAEALTGGSDGTTVWFDAGRKPVVVKPAGMWTPWQHGYVWFTADGDPTKGFVRDGAQAWRVTAAGLANAPDVVAALWQDTVAVRCPVADVVKHDLEPTGPELGPAACQGAGAEAEARLAAQITTRIEDRARARAILLTDGAPTIDWGCNRRELTAVATYCESETSEPCSDGGDHARWLHEVWTGRADAMTLLERTSTSSEMMEWAVNGSLSIVGHADLDGDGELDPIFDRSSHEGGASVSEHSYEAVVGGKLIPLDSMESRDADIAVGVVRIPGRAADAVVLARDASDPPELMPALTDVIVVAGGHAHTLTGAARRAVLHHR